MSVLAHLRLSDNGGYPFFLSGSSGNLVRKYRFVPFWTAINVYCNICKTHDIICTDVFLCLNTTNIIVLLYQACVSKAS